MTIFSRSSPHGIPLATVLAFCLLTGCSDGSGGPETQGEQADLVITDANVYTLRWPEPDREGRPAAGAPAGAEGWRGDAEAIAMKSGRIVAVGSDAEMRQWIGADTQVLAVGGATVLPGLVDSHTHVFELGATLNRVDLFGVRSEEEAVARVVEAARSVPEGQWIVGQGWDDGAWANDYPDLTLLSEEVPAHPVLLRSLHGFAAWGNRMALARAGITAETEAPAGGEILRFESGEPSGILLNRAVPVLDAAVPPPTREQLRAQVLLALEQMARDGYVAVHEAGVSADQMAVLKALEAEGRLPIRVYAMLSARDAPLARRWLERGPDTDSERFLVTRSVKAYYDGALGSRGARLLADYSDLPGHRGVSGDAYGFDEALVAELMRAGFQVGIHAIGDAGNRETLDFIASVYAQHPGARDQRHRIEHAQVVHPDDFARFAQLNLIASMEPPHAVEDKAWAETRIGPERIRGAYAWRTFRRNGVALTFNADNPGSDHSIFYGLHAAVTRRDRDVLPPDGWHPEQAVSIEEAVRGYTVWSAYAAFNEDRTGIIAPGRWADVTVMDIDPFALAETEPDRLLDGQIIATVVDGRLVYPEEADAPAGSDPMNPRTSAADRSATSSMGK